MNLILKLFTWTTNRLHSLLESKAKQTTNRLDSAYEQVKLFHKTFNIQMPNSPTPLSKEDALIRASFIAEELVELLHASCDDELKLQELYLDLLDKMDISLARELKKDFPKDDFERLVAQADAMTDISYFNLGNFTLIDVNPDPLFDIVQSANMNKLWNDSLPRFNEVGKIMKPPNWETDFAPEPKIEKEIKRQIEDAKEVNNK